MISGSEGRYLKKLLLIGGGGHCRSVLDCILSMNEYDRIGVIDKSKRDLHGAEVVGTDDDLPSLYNEGWTDAFITIGSVGDTSIRRRLFQLAEDIGFHIPVIIDPTAVVAHDVILEKGCFVGKRAVINSGSRIGQSAIINTGTLIEHDCEIGEFSHISPGAVLCGQVSVGMDTHIGAGSVVRQQIKIGNNVLVGIGSVVTKNIDDRKTAFGNPCKVIR